MCGASWRNMPSCITHSHQLPHTLPHPHPHPLALFFHLALEDIFHNPSQSLLIFPDAVHYVHSHTRAMARSLPHSQAVSLLRAHARALSLSVSLRFSPPSLSPVLSISLTLSRNRFGLSLPLLEVLSRSRSFSRARAHAHAHLPRCGTCACPRAFSL